MSASTKVDEWAADAPDSRREVLTWLNMSITTESSMLSITKTIVSIITKKKSEPTTCNHTRCTLDRQCS